MATEASERAENLKRTAKDPAQLDLSQSKDVKDNQLKRNHFRGMMRSFTRLLAREKVGLQSTKQAGKDEEKLASYEMTTSKKEPPSEKQQECKEMPAMPDDDEDIDTKYILEKIRQLQGN